MRKYSKIVFVSCRSKYVRYLPMHELFIAEALKRSDLVNEVEVFTILENENVTKYLQVWGEADFIFFWEYYGIKSPTYALRYFALAELVKRECSKPVYYGGYWATSYGRYFKDFEVFDKIFEGYSIDRLVDVLSSDNFLDNSERFVSISGDSNYDKYPLNLSFLTTPDRNLFNGTLYGYLSAFSCPLNCKFCNVNSKRSEGSGFVARSIESVKKDIDAFIEFFDFHTIVIKDLNFFSNSERAFQILSYLNEKYKEASVYLDVTLYDFNEELVGKLKTMNMVDYYFGLESFDPEERKMLGKPYSDKQLEAAFETAEKYQVNLTGNVIIGLPWQDRNHIEKTISKTLYYINRHKHVFLTINCYKPEYGTYIQKQYFSDVHNKIDFKSLIDLFLNKSGKLQSLIYGTKFDFINMERLSTVVRLIDHVKRIEHQCPRIMIGIFRAFRRLLESNLNSSFLDNRLIAPVLTVESVRFFSRYILNLFSIPFLKKTLTNVLRFSF